MKERQKYESDEMAQVHMFQGDVTLIQYLEDTYKQVQTELNQLREAKELRFIEEHVREQVRE